MMIKEKIKKNDKFSHKHKAFIYLHCLYNYK